MRQAQKVIGVRTTKPLSQVSRLLQFLLVFLPVTLAVSAAHAGPGQDFDQYATVVTNKTNILVDLFNYVAYISGAMLAALGISDLKKHVENPQNPLKNALAKLFFAALFLSLPYIASIVAQTMGASFSPISILLAKSFTFKSAAIKAGGIGGLIKNGINNIGVLVNVASYIAFVVGFFFVFRGLQMLRAHIENPQTPLPEGLKRLGAGGALLSFPVIANVIETTFGARGSVITNSGWKASAGGAAGLDGMMVSFMQDISNPAYFAIEVFCYVAGILIILFAMQRLVKTAQDGPRGPLSFGTITMFVVSALLLSLPQFLSVINESIFGGSQALTKVTLMSLSGAMDAAQKQNAINVLSAVLAFMAVIGFLSVVRGLFILKAFADGGQQASMMSVVTHIVAGALAINLGAFINAVQTSLGITDFPVTFS